MLGNEAFTQQISLIISNWNKTDPITSWEGIKIKIQTVSQKETEYHQKQSVQELKALQRTLQYINKRIYEGEILECDKSNIEAKISPIRDREWFMWDGDRECDWALREGKMTPTFLYLEDLAPNPGLEALDIDGEIMDDITLILEELNAYYTDLYTARDRKSSQEIASFLNRVKSLPKVLGDMSGLTQPIQESETVETIKSLWPGKLPGSDGLTSSFYKHFCLELSPILTVVFNEAYHLGRLSPTQYLAIIVLLYKKDLRINQRIIVLFP